MDKKRKGHPRPCIKYTKEEMKKYLRSINHVKYVGDNGVKEKFKQVKIKGIWCPYIISSFGRLFSVHYHSIPGCIKEMSRCEDKDGYYLAYVNFNGTTCYTKIHRLVALMFVKNPDKKHKDQVNHIDGDKHNNMSSNLEWVTNYENKKHAIEHGLVSDLSGEDIWCSIYTNDQIRHVCRMLEKNVPIKEIMKTVGVTNYLIHDVLRHKKWKDISKDYDFSNYHFGKDIEKLTKICELLESNKYTMTEIANSVGCDVKLVHTVLTRHGHADISKGYDFSDFIRDRTHKQKKGSTTIEKVS